jgi:hypothetical protein
MFTNPEDEGTRFLQNKLTLHCVKAQNTIICATIAMKTLKTYIPLLTFKGVSMTTNISEQYKLREYTTC